MANKHKYYVWDTDSRGGYTTLSAVQNFSDDQLLYKGVSVIKDFPKEGVMNMNKDHKGDKKLGDAIHSRGGQGVPVISPKLAEIIKAATNGDKIEFLPVAIHGFEDEVVSTDYVIANTFKVIDCIDHEESEVSWNLIDPTIIADITNLTLLTDKIPDDAVFFRATGWDGVIIRDDLVEQINQAEPTGVGIMELEEVGC